jgi:predicted molibdopterin-dependent oxidoreductase YjgC
LQQYNVGTMTQRTPNRELAPADELEIHERDARAAGVADGEVVHVESHWGATHVPARISERVQPGTVFLSFHYAHSATNRLVGPHVDPLSKCPEYKLTAVRVSPTARRP